MPHKLRALIPVAVIILFSLFLFRDYFLKGSVPFPSNLLVSYYEPWKSYPVPEYPNGPPNKAMGFDNLRIYYPVKRVALEALRMGEPPLWNPYNFAGNVLLGTYQSAIFHPLSVLFLVLPMIDAWSTIIILQPVAAAISMYLFLRTLGLRRSSGLLGSLAFACSGFFMTWWQESYMFTYSALFLPLALAAYEQYRKGGRVLYLALMAASLALSVVAGAFQMTFYVYAFVTVWVVYRIWNVPHRTRELLSYAGVVLLSVALAAVHLLPGLEAYMQSTRMSSDIKYIFDAYLLPLYQLVTLVAPDYFGNPATYNYFGSGFYHERLMYIGVVPLLLLFTQLFRRNATGHHRIFFSAAFLVTLSLTLSLPTTWLILYYLKLPLISTMTPSRMMMLVAFSASVLSAIAVEEYWKGFVQKTVVRVSLVLGVAFAGAFAAPFVLKYLDAKNTSYIISLRNMIIPGMAFAGAVLALILGTRFRGLRKAGFLGLVGIVCITTLLFARKYLYVSERRFVYPPSPVFTALRALDPSARFWTYDNGYIEKNFASYYGVFSPEGYDSIMVRRYAELLAYGNSGGKTSEPDRANALIRSTDHMNDIFADPFRVKLLGLTGVRYIVAKLVPDRNEQTLLPPPPQLSRVWDDGTYAIYAYANAQPRVLLATDIRVLPKERDILKTVFDPATDLGKTVVLETRPPVRIWNPEATGSAKITGITPNTVTVHTETSDNMMLFLSDSYYPGWNAYVNGKRAPVYRANYAFRAVPVPHGTHTVVFKYEPLSWKAGLATSATGLLILMALLWMGRKRKR